MIRYLALLESHKIFECPVCMVEIPLSEAPSRPPSAKCTHDPNVCSECLTAMLVAQITGGRWEYIKCPTPGCEEELDGKDVQVFTPPETFRSYNEFVMNRALSQDPNFRWCCGRISGGQESCTWGQLHSARGPNEWRCIKCQQLNCFKCKGSGHPEETCEAYQARQNDSGANDRRILQLTKRCPKKGCGNRIEKNGGCINMKCKRLQTEYNNMNC
jgi:IBR domain, a half RING-finger domain